MKHLIIACLSMAALSPVYSQYKIDLSHITPTPVKYLELGNPGIAGKEIRVNNLYMEEGGIPQLPVNLYFQINFCILTFIIKCKRSTRSVRHHILSKNDIRHIIGIDHKSFFFTRKECGNQTAYYYQKYISITHHATFYLILLSESGNGRTKFASVGRMGSLLRDVPAPE